MKKLFANLLLAVLVMAPSAFLSQNCHGTVKYCPNKKKEGFTYNGQSLSGAFVQGDTAEVTIIVYKNMEYRMSLCSPTQYDLNGKFEFQVVEKITKPGWKDITTYETVEKYNEETGELIGEERVEKKSRKRVYNKVEVVRYDNKKDEDAQEFIFVSDKTRKLTIKVYIPEVPGVDENEGLGAEAYACVGLLIEHQPAAKTGFNR